MKKYFSKIFFKKVKKVCYKIKAEGSNNNIEIFN